MTKLISKYKNIYIFLVTLSFLGYISGYFYYQIQPKDTKDNIKETMSIEESLENRVNNLPKCLKSSFQIFLNTLLIIPVILNVFSIFYKPFQIGFIFHVLEQYNIKLSIIYTTVYLLIPIIFNLILIRIGITFISSIIKNLFYNNKSNRTIIKKSFKKYLLISILSIIYEIIIIIVSPIINTYLMAIL